MNAVAIIQTFLGFGIAFVLLPWLILPTPKSARNTLDVFVINFLRWIAIVVVVTQVLAALRLYETTTLIILSVIACYWFKLRPMGVDRQWFSGLGERISVRAANFGDRFESGEAQVSSRTRASKKTATAERGVDSDKPSRRDSLPSVLFMLILIVPLVIVLGISYYLRVKVPAAHVSLSPSDNYTILTWTKLLEQNQIYTEGIYPHGVHAIMALWHKFSLGLDMADLIRFSGPLMTLFIPTGALFTVLRLTRNPGAAVFAASIFGIFGSRAEFLVPWARQSAPLPQELSLGIAMITLAFVAMAVTSRHKGHLWTVGAGCFAMAMIHPLPLFVFFAAGGALAIGTGIFAKGGMPAAMQTIGAMLLGGLAGHIYIPLGLLFGKALFAGIRDLLPFVGTAGAADAAAEQSVVQEFGQNAISVGSFIGALFGFFGGFVMLATKRRSTGAMMIGLSATAVVLVVLFDTSLLGIPAFYAMRIVWIVGPALALGYGVGLAGILSVVPMRVGIARVAISVAVAVLAIFVFSARFPIDSDAGSALRVDTDYEAISVETRKIMRSSENFTYTVVGIPEQGQRVLGDGFFVELWVFARDIRTQDAARPGYELPIPAEDVYITIEKDPLIGLDLSEGANNPTNEYYRTEVKRGRIMAIVYEWAEIYRRYHSDMSIHYDDSNVRIYGIHRTADFKLADESSQFKRYKYEEDVLFNSGPTIEQVLDG